MSEGLDKYLAIAKALRDTKGKVGAVKFITGALKVSGRDVGKTKKLIEMGLIRYARDGYPEFTVSEEKVLEVLGEMKKTKRPPPPPPPSVEELTSRVEDESARSVTEAVVAEVAREASERAQQYINLGKAVRELVVKHAPSLGYTPEQISSGVDIDKLVREALSYLAIGKDLEEENKRLRSALAFYVSRLDPVVRLERAMELLTRFAEFALLADALGFDVERMPLAKRYEEMVSKYLSE